MNFGADKTSQPKSIKNSVEKTLEEKLGSEIEDWKGYNQLMLNIVNKVVPYDQMINIVNEFDKEKYEIYIPEHLK